MLTYSLLMLIHAEGSNIVYYTFYCFYLFYFSRIAILCNV